MITDPIPSRDVLRQQDDYQELRVHGVAGTSPESMLGLAAQLQATGYGGTTVADAPAAPRAAITTRAAEPRSPVKPHGPVEPHCPVEPQPGDVSVWAPPSVSPDLRAFSWSSLTSGHWYQAFYLVLLPFMIANLAGWMIVGRAPVRRGRALRLSTLLVRMVGMLVTGVFVVSMQILVADLVVLQWLRHAAGWPLYLGPPLTAAVLVGAVVLTRIRQPRKGHPEPWTNYADPVGQSSLEDDQDLMWNSPGINVTLRWLHLVAGLATIALLAAWPSVGVESAWFGQATRLLAVVTGIVAIGMLAVISLGNGSTGMRPVMKSVRWLSLPAGLAVAAATAYQATLPTGITDHWTSLPALRGAIVWIAAAVLVGVVVLTVVGRYAGGGRAAVNAPSLLLLGASIGAMFGAGLAGQLARLTEAGCGATSAPCWAPGEYVKWLAIGVTIALAGLVAVTLVRGAQFIRKEHSWRNAAHLLSGHGTWVTLVLLIEGSLLLAAGLLIASGGIGPVFPPVVVDVAEWVVVALVAGPVVAGAVVVAWNGPAAGRRRSHLPVNSKVWLGRALALAALAGIGWIVAATTWTYTVLGVPLPPRSFVDFALDLAVLLPTAAILTRIYSGLTNRGVRRGVGVLWDVGTFWPRWFHPLAPPTYADRAVPLLAADIAANLEDGQRMLLAPHSQGAVIAAAAVLQGPRQDRLAMLSYGSPWEHLYARFFPLYVNTDTTQAVIEKLGGVARWHNLYRVTDPIGGRIDGVEQEKGMPDPCNRGHSDYWVEPEYHEAAAALRAELQA